MYILNDVCFEQLGQHDALSIIHVLFLKRPTQRESFDE